MLKKPVGRAGCALRCAGVYRRPPANYMCGAAGVDVPFFKGEKEKYSVAREEEEKEEKKSVASGGVDDFYHFCSTGNPGESFRLAGAPRNLNYACGA